MLPTNSIQRSPRPNRWRNPYVISFQGLTAGEYLQQGRDAILPDQSESESSAYRLDEAGPTTIGRERARLLNSYSEVDSTASELE
jgi:hypothetical protein